MKEVVVESLNIDLGDVGLACLQDMLQEYNDFMDEHPNVKDTCFVEVEGIYCKYYHVSIPLSEWPHEDGKGILTQDEYDKLNDLMHLIRTAIYEENQNINREVRLIENKRHYELTIINKRCFKIIKHNDEYLIACLRGAGISSSDFVVINDIEFNVLEDAENYLSKKYLSDGKFISKEITYSYE